MPEINRPLSPHIGIYSWQISNTLSILHRLTGIALAFGALVLLSWVISAALGPDAYAAVTRVLAGPLGLLVLFGVSASYFYHLANGIRHLAWDAGFGFEKQVARASGWFAVGAALLATAALWWGVLL
ncbi:MAG: succinate dehydrogenase, cytochrome b556 subunit [Gammaproteobacteria bacterium]|jgi:succinate dehydrogenase / fumarate reductase cytochrome b subunit|nr:succinate dehydrogenase, cytochrome b556 subunit [Gammaproteobacteria bacterium]